MAQQTFLDFQWDAIHLGDCVAGMDSLPAATFDLVFADPPFNIGYEYDVYRDSKAAADYLSWSRTWIEAVHRVLKSDGTFWLAIGDEFAAELKLEAQQVGFHLRSWVIWYYTFGVNCKAKFSRSHVHLFYFVKDRQKFTFRQDALENRIPSARLLVYEDRRGNPRGRLPDDTWILRPQDLAECFTPAEDTWYLPRVAGTFKERRGFHGCQMPEQLLGRILRCCTLDEGLVLDPFSGSGTTLAVAKKLGRRFMGFDLSPEYVQRGSDRLAGICIGDPLEGAPEPTMSAPGSMTLQRSRRGGSRSPLETILERSEAQQELNARLVYEERLVKAFRASHQGYSLDRVVIDPQLNSQLEEECRRRHVPGDLRWWNRTLFRLRKAGRLAHLPASRRTTLSWEECDPFLFASEIAWRQMVDRGHLGLDEIFSDPSLARQFDAVATRWAPGFPIWQYRWGALKLRKEFTRATRRAQLFGRESPPMWDPLPATKPNLDQLPESAGIYILTAGGRNGVLYAGGTLHLRLRLQRQCGSSSEDLCPPEIPDLTLCYLEGPRDVPLLLSYQSLCVRQYQPQFNVLHPADRGG